MTDNIDKEIEEVAVLHTKFTITAAELLEKTRNEAIGKEIPILPYLVAVYIEYLELKKQAVELFGQEEVETLLHDFEMAHNNGELNKSKEVVKYDPAYR